MATSLKSLIGGGIKSIQRGKTTGNSNVITISPVDLDKSIVNSTALCTNSQFGGYTAQLTASDKLTISAGSTGSGGVIIVSWEVIEYA